MSNSVGSFLENPQIGNAACKSAAQLIADFLRVKSTNTISPVNTSTEPKFVAFMNSAKLTNSFTAEQITKFEDRLTILLMRLMPTQRKIKKHYEIPELILEAAAFDAFALTRDQLPNNFQLLLNGQDVLLISIGSSDLELMVFPTVTSL